MPGTHIPLQDSDIKRTSACGRLATLQRPTWRLHAPHIRVEEREHVLTVRQKAVAIGLCGTMVSASWRRPWVLLEAKGDCGSHNRAGGTGKQRDALESPRVALPCMPTGTPRAKHTRVHHVRCWGPSTRASNHSSVGQCRAPCRCPDASRSVALARATRVQQGAGVPGGRATSFPRLIPRAAGSSKQESNHNRSSPDSSLIHA